ncbi:helix-turn-helix transcriptional regulator [Streptomyces sp. KL110A]|uniref:helix-turn-helix domain-containing protein n=1 Tax=Streptomyces sp. KL110A TaxID=3384221 RepID=UPI0038BFF5A9
MIVAADCHAEALVRGLALESPTAVPARPDGGDGLTEAERRVAAMAAVGCSNREIAEGLHVTVSTVEQHLTRTYRKLRISRRADLPPLLGGPALGDLTDAHRR